MQDTAQLDPWGPRKGGRRYSFNNDDSYAVLFQRCFARDGRHDFVSGSRTPGPNAWVDSVAVSASTDSGPHLKYSTGQLYDNIYSRDLNGNGGGINVRNRGDSGGDRKFCQPNRRHESSCVFFLPIHSLIHYAIRWLEWRTDHVLELRWFLYLRCP